MSIDWQHVLDVVFTDDPFSHVDPRGDGITGPDGGVHRRHDKTWVVLTLETPADHFRIAGALNNIGLQLQEIPENAERLEIPYEQLARGTVKDLVEWAENYGLMPSELMQLLLDHPDAVDLLDNN